MNRFRQNLKEVLLDTALRDLNIKSHEVYLWEPYLYLNIDLKQILHTFFQTENSRMYQNLLYLLRYYALGVQ